MGVKKGDHRSGLAQAPPGAAKHGILSPQLLRCREGGRRLSSEPLAPGNSWTIGLRLSGFVVAHVGNPQTASGAPLCVRVIWICTE
jgi:hypothetical protein